MLGHQVENKLTHKLVARKANRVEMETSLLEFLRQSARTWSQATWVLDLMMANKDLARKTTMATDERKECKRINLMVCQQRVTLMKNSNRKKKAVRMMLKTLPGQITEDLTACHLLERPETEMIYLFHQLNKNTLCYLCRTWKSRTKITKLVKHIVKNLLSSKIPSILAIKFTISIFIYRKTRKINSTKFSKRHFLAIKPKV